MKVYLAWIKKTVVSGIGFAVIFLTSISSNNIALIPSKWVPLFNLLVGMAATYTVWKVTNGPKPVREVL